MTPEGWALRTRLALAAASGVLTTAAFPPLDAGWVALVALVPLLLALRGARARDGALLGAVWGAVFFGALLYWISYFGYAAWIALVLLMTAHVTAFGALAARAQRSTAARLVGIPALWAAAELMGERIPFGGFTWGSLGYSQHGGGPLLHLARAGGVFSVSFALVVCGALMAELVAGGSRERRAALLLALSGVVLAPGLLPLGLAGPKTSTLDVAAVQGNVPRDRFTGFGRRGRVGPEDFTIVNNHLAVMKRLEGQVSPELIVWPENSFDRDPRYNPQMFDPVREELARLNTHLLAGAVLDEGTRWTNSNLLFDPQGNIVGRYNKVHLVPFGEYVPVGFFRRIVPALDRELPIDGIAGKGTLVFDVNGKRFGSLICFESTYPELARTSVRHGAQLLVVTTNDASFGRSPAARQHLAMSQMRAVEEGRAVVHAAISGISAMIAPDGKVTQRAGLFAPALLRATLPMTGGQTPYARYGGWSEAILCALAIAAAAAGMRWGRGS